MAMKQRSVEEVMSKLRGAEVALAQGEALGQACGRIGVSDQTFYRWCREYGGLKVDQAKRLRDIEGENASLRRAVADLTLDNQILKEAARGNF
jgi:transposase-like protein